MKRQYVKDLKPGIPIDDVFFVTRRDIRERRDGTPFLTFDLMDKTGNVAAIMWDRVEDAISCVEPGGFFRVQGKLGNYQGRPQLTVAVIYPADPKDIDRDDFLRATRHDRGKMMSELQSYIETVEDRHLKKLLAAFFDEESFTKEFALAPGGAQVHHNYLGGLLEHTVMMARVAAALPTAYPELNHDLLMTGVLLHDVGKVREYTYEVALDHTWDGRLIGHIVMGYEIVKEKMSQIPGFPEELGRMLLHTVLAHHGHLEHGSPKTPKFAEAIVVYFLDNMDARIMMFRGAIEKNPGTKWTDYQQYLETNVYIPDRPKVPES
ncbi:MAG: HD domain-containing protein [candidate division WOR-3 bacterium]|nr:MAG: HD domain-containing protein [candidate division WOR-3 bacterium]